MVKINAKTIATSMGHIGPHKMSLNVTESQIDITVMKKNKLRPL